MVLVSISDVLDCAGEFKRPLVEGEAILESDLLIMIGSLPADDDNEETSYVVKALCLQTSALFSLPHAIEVHLDLDVIVGRVQSISRSCKAGESAKCKHAIATLMHLNKLKKWEDLDEISCTDLEQMWGKLRPSVKKDFEAVPTIDFCHVEKEKTAIYSRGIPDVPVSDEQASNFARAIHSTNKESEAFIHSSLSRAAASEKNRIEEGEDSSEKMEEAKSLVGKLLETEAQPTLNKLKEMTGDKRKTLPANLVHFYENHVKVDEDKSLRIATESVSQCNQQWFEERKKRFTGSICYCLFTYCKNKQPDWYKKFSSVFKSFSGNDATVYGLQCEPLARAKYVEKKGVPVHQCGLLILLYLG